MRVKQCKSNFYLWFDDLMFCSGNLLHWRLTNHKMSKIKPRVYCFILLRKQHPVSKHHKEGSRKLLFLLWITFIQCCSLFSSRLPALRMFLVEAGLSDYFHNPLNSDMDYRIFNGRVWPFRIMYAHGGLRFRVSSEGLLQTGEILGREKNLVRNGHPSIRWPCTLHRA